MKLNLCCGTNLFPGWVNIDKTNVEADYLRHLRDAPEGFVWPPEQQKLADAVKAGQLEFIRHDVRKGLPYADGSVEAIYVGQAIEHFNRRTEAPALLSECRRVLKPGGSIRLTTPDIRTLVAGFNLLNMGVWAYEQPAFYVDALPEDQLSYLLFGASGDNCTADNYEGHFHCYTTRSLYQLLTECGFDCDWNAQMPDVFSDTIDKGMSHSFAIEAVKP